MSQTGVTTVVSRTPRAGREGDYEQCLHGVIEAASKFAGHHGATVLRPSPGSRNYVLVFRFATEEELATWDASPERAEWIEKMNAMCEPAAISRASGLETWFTLPGGGAFVPPPRWKMAIVSWLVAFPLIQLLNATLGRVLVDVPALLRGALLGGVMIVLMTWLAMPAATRLFKKFLYTGSPS
jgi:uncharacterized protein